MYLTGGVFQQRIACDIGASATHTSVPINEPQASICGTQGCQFHRFDQPIEGIVHCLIRAAVEHVGKQDSKGAIAQLHLAVVTAEHALCRVDRNPLQPCRHLRVVS